MPSDPTDQQEHPRSCDKTGDSELSTSAQLHQNETSEVQFSETKAKPSQHITKLKSTQVVVPTPTQYLLDTLQDFRCSVIDADDQIRASKHIVDATIETSEQRSDLLRQKKSNKKPPRLSLQTILADYIRAVDPLLNSAGGTYSDIPATIELDEALRNVFGDKTVQYLETRHYNPADVQVWSWILRSTTPYEAMLRILMLESAQDTRVGSKARIIPPFIPLLLLRRQNLDVKTFRLLLIYSLHVITGQPVPPFDLARSEQWIDSEVATRQESPQTELLVEPTTCFAFIIRLLRHAREVWPQAQLTIARSFSFYLNLLQADKCSSEATRQRRNQFMADKFNACLWLLSLPCKSGPFKSVSIQQQAQFELLRAMAGHKPVLPVTRQGYQGIIAVQLAHKKTSDERQSADLKAPSWPPWKEEKLGIDSHRGNEGMRSRAMRVMAQMKEAGYSHTRWEEISAILAGWDTDKSPTVQTRSLMRRPQLLRGPAGSKPNHHAVWVARIRATRTVREAWACFLSYQDQGLPPRASVYVAMAEKLIFRRQAIENHFDQISHALPGDGLEVFPEPSSARDLIYVHTEPATLEELLKQMLSQGIRPSRRFLALLLRSAQTFSSGLDYLSCSDLTDEQIEVLCTVWGRKSDYQMVDQDAMEKLPDYVFSSFICFLCNFSNLDSLHLARHEIRTAHLFPILMGDAINRLKTSTLFSYASDSGDSGALQHPRALSHAIQLLRLRQPRSPPAWIHVLAALGRDRITAPYRRMSRSTQRILAWYEILEVTGWMKERAVEPGLQGFLILCNSFTRAVVAGLKHPDAVEDGLALVQEAARWGNIAQLDDPHPRYEDMVRSGLGIIKEHFDQLVLSDSMTSPLLERTVATLESATSSQVKVPPMMHVPTPAVLHAFVRALGLAGDRDGLLNLVRWMSHNAETLKETSDEHLNGDRMMRRTLIALRVFLEGHGEKLLSGLSGEFSHGSSHEGDEYAPSLESGSQAAETISFSDPYLQEAYELITATSSWGSWPSDDELWKYLHWEH
ncbi:uncharacterized protein ACLA_039370 [Aspergillus clavatus NRRL 1]|uniref:Prefoldin subunit n=1 Tax=Aspergillus clavatus (strain ATCC 1007 / CBS 513.65 / DSM 816 / NCTC 3887 / NRRL 1 / QM 1276 / 107) TaxID=344612 RepID=A1CKP8_ASPCL|nr:uncharacterized protein ACLA_039370 [Aspergillus clavatus NRRL 1]EAW09722.1 conserved hypothetical protein [Aspergillus clavatus NRRL 1]